MSGWTTKKLGEVCEEIRERISSAEIPLAAYITTDNMLKNCAGVCEAENLPPKICSLVLYQSGDILLSNIRPYLKKIWLADRSGGASSDVIVLRPRFENILARYIYRALARDEFFDFSMLNVTGTKMPRGKRDWIKSFEIPIPPLAEQKRIVAKIDAAFEKIDRLKANAEKNLANAKELFQSALDEAMRPKKGWVEKRLPDISVNRDSKRVPITKSQRKSGTIPYYGASGIVDYVKDYIFDGEYLLVSEDGANLESRTYPIAFSITGKSWVNNHAHILEFKNGDVQAYVELYLNAISLKDFITGTAQPKLTQENLNKIPIHLPGEHAILSGVVGRLKMIKGKLETLQQNYARQIADCAEMRQAILREAFEGRMRTRRDALRNLAGSWIDARATDEIAKDIERHRTAGRRVDL